jgi:hypothetical protein
MTTETQPTCEQRIAEMMKDREEQLAVIYENPESDDYEDPALSIDTKQVTTVCFSWGGPSDYLEIVHNGAEIETVTYRFSDWFDTATLPVTDGHLWTYAQYIIEGMGN